MYIVHNLLWLVKHDAESGQWRQWLSSWGGGWSRRSKNLSSGLLVELCHPGLIQPIILQLDTFSFIHFDLWGRNAEALESRNKRPSSKRICLHHWRRHKMRQRMPAKELLQLSICPSFVLKSEFSFSMLSIVFVACPQNSRICCAVVGGAGWWQVLAYTCSLLLYLHLITFPKHFVWNWIASPQLGMTSM